MNQLYTAFSLTDHRSDDIRADGVSCTYTVIIRFETSLFLVNKMSTINADTECDYDPK